MKPTSGLAALAVLLSACGSSPSVATRHPSPSPSAPSASPAAAPSPTPPTAADLALGRLLISAADLPAGYSPDAAAVGSTLVSSRSDSSCSRRASAASALHTVGPLAPAARARRSFSAKSGGPSLRVTLARYRSAAAAARVVQAIHSVFQTCRSFTLKDPKTAVSTAVTLSPLAFPKLGDEGVATTGRLVRGQQSLGISLVFVRRGATIAYLAEVWHGGMHVSALEKAARAQVRRVPAA